MSLPPLAPPLAAARRSQPRKPLQQLPPAATPRRAAAAAPVKPLRKGRGGTPPAPECSDAFSNSWSSASLQKRLPRSTAAQGSKNSATTQTVAAPASALPPPPARGRSVLAPPGSDTRSCEGLCPAQGGRGEAALRFSLSLPPEAVRLLQRRSLEKQQRQQRARTPRHASLDAAKLPLAAVGVAGGDLRTLLKVSLLNECHRYDDVEYEEAAGASGACQVDEGLVRKCTEWLRGVESATARDHGDKLDTLPHLSTL
ncbi:proline-rich protein 18 [Eublepharis macularius]|uniref:Proline-rich protein 18 n=1 Tax=Eublepharis macularius TaxID=481883 RepID=A0AA97KKA9_EUBMA|nr:proline-rich protein 18 [Eublepharis macularius]